MKKLVSLFAITILFISTCLSQSESSIEWTDCFLDNCSVLKDKPIKFGKLKVPEDYDKPEGRKIAIAFTVIQSEAPNPSEDPLIIFQGGWGLPILDATGGYQQNFPIKDRDVILYDYRGTGYSEPQLCDWVGEESWEDIKKDLSVSEYYQNSTKRFNECLDQLTERGINFNKYGSNNKARDGVVLAENLGYPSYNLFGISYGTRSIQDFVRAADSSNIQIRSIMSDSNVPIGNPQNGTMAIVYQNVLEKILLDCANSSKCNEAFPDLKNKYITFLNSLDKEPLKLETTSGAQLFLNREEVNSIVHQLMYDYKNHKDIPILLTKFIERDVRFFEAMIPRFEGMVHKGIAGLGLVGYTYDWKLFREEGIAIYKNNLSRNPEFQVLDSYIEYYGGENRIKIDSLSGTPISSEIPTLLLTGEYDPITPPAWTQMMEDVYSNNVYVELPKVGHGAIMHPCGMNVYKQFLANPDEKPDLSCITDMGDNAITFRTTYYDNSKIRILASNLFTQMNMVTILLLAIPIVVCFVILIRSLIGLFKKKKTVFQFIGAGTILVFVVGLLYYIYRTSGEDLTLLALGLVGGASWVFYLVPLIVLIMLFALFNIFRTHKAKVWNMLLTIASVMVLVVVIQYELIPNF